jgi:hypothetical protein
MAIRFILAPCHQILSVRPIDKNLILWQHRNRKTSPRGLEGRSPGNGCKQPTLEALRCFPSCRRERQPALSPKT